MKDYKLKYTVKQVAYSALMLALVYCGTLLGFSSAQFYFNLGDTVILIASAIFGPFTGMIAGGFGSFFADLTVYPATMVYTLEIKGLEGLISGLAFQLIRRYMKDKKISGILNIVVGLGSTLFMALGYFVCQTFMYGSLAGGLVALPWDVLQAIVSVGISMVVLLKFKLINYNERIGFMSWIKEKNLVEHNEQVKREI